MTTPQGVRRRHQLGPGVLTPAVPPPMNGLEGGAGLSTGLRAAHTAATLLLLEYRLASTLNDSRTGGKPIGPITGIIEEGVMVRQIGLLSGKLFLSCCW